MTTKTPADPAPALHGLRVIEFSHMVMGPTCGLVLGDLGAEVIKVEPLAGDGTRRLLGSGAGFFVMFNRNKKSIALDLKQPKGRKAALKLIATADVVIENFKAGTMASMGLDYDTLAKQNERLIYVSHKGFLPGPYDHRTALDEVVQMMGGLAYMTGRPGDPLRAGSSVNDIMGGMFGAIGVMAALAQRAVTGKGQQVQCGLFENNVFLMAQHMLQFAVTGAAAAPMPSRISPWAVYDVFTVKGGEQIFLAVVSDSQWAVFCKAFGLHDMLADTRLVTNNDRVRARSWMMPVLRSAMASVSTSELGAVFEKHGLPFALIIKPEDLFDDPHLAATGGLAAMALPDGTTARAPLMPITLGGARPGIKLNPPRLGEHTDTLLAELGYSSTQIRAMKKALIAKAD